MRGRWIALRQLVGAALLAVPCWPVAGAEIWGYVDAQGNTHFAPEKVDERYELLFRTGVDANPPPAAPPPPAEVVAPPVAPAPQTQTVLSPRLHAFFAGSSTYRDVQKHLREAAKIHDIDYELLKALIVAESGFNTQAVSPKGAVGLMQIMPGTAERYGVASDAKAPVEVKLTDPRTNIRIGTRYLRFLLNLFPNRLDLALAAYNAGEGAVQRAGNRIPNYRETQNYVRTVMELYSALKPPAPRVDARAAESGRVRVVMGAPAAAVDAPPGGAATRGNLLPAWAQPPLQPSRPSEPSRPSIPSAPSVPLGAAKPSGPSGPLGPTSSLLPSTTGASPTTVALAPDGQASPD